MEQAMEGRPLLRALCWEEGRATCSAGLPDSQDTSASLTANTDTQNPVEYSTHGLT